MDTDNPNQAPPSNNNQPQATESNNDSGQPLADLVDALQSVDTNTPETSSNATSIDDNNGGRIELDEVHLLRSSTLNPMDTAQTDQELLEKEFNTSTLPIDEMLRGDKELPIFLSEWLNNGLKASAAYKALHPKVSNASARVLGSKKLAKINISAILSGYDLGYSDYILGLKEGLSATKLNEQTGEKVPDYKTRLEFHRILGKLLGF